MGMARRRNRRKRHIIEGEKWREGIDVTVSLVELDDRHGGWFGGGKVCAREDKDGGSRWRSWPVRRSDGPGLVATVTCAREQCWRCRQPCQSKSLRRRAVEGRTLVSLAMLHGVRTFQTLPSTLLFLFECSSLHLHDLVLHLLFLV